MHWRQHGVEPGEAAHNGVGFFMNNRPSIPGTREVFDGNTRIGITVVNPREFQDYYTKVVNIERIRQAWAESWRRRNP